MSDITLRVNADFETASKAFKELAESSEATREKIEKFSDSFQTQNVDKFIDKQKLLETSLTGTRGSVQAMQSASNNYQKEIERLIKSGLDPESEAIKRLREEQQKLKDKIKDTNDIQEQQTKLMKGAQTAAVALYAAIAAGAAATLAAAQKTAEMGDQIAKTSRQVGIGAEALQELQYAAKQSGVKDLTPVLQNLNKTIGAVKDGTGKLTSYLEENDKELLNQLKNVKSNEEAFTLLTNAINKAPNEFERARLASIAFGGAGNDMILMAQNGAEGIAELREEARKYGVMTSEAAAQSEAYLDAQTRLKAALTGVSTELTSKLIPSLTQTVNGIANFIASVDDWAKVLEIAGYALAGLTAGLTAFLIITKGVAAIHAVATAFRALTAAMAANPFGAIAVLITAVLIPAIIALYRNWDTVQTYLSQGVGRLEYAFKWFASQIKEKLIIAFNAIKIAGVTLIDFIYGNIIRAVGQLLEVMGKLPFVGEMFNEASQQVMRLGNAIGNLAEETRQSSRDAIQAAKDEQDATEQALRDKLAGIDAAAKARRDELEARKKQINDEQEFERQHAELEAEILQERNEVIQQLEDEKVSIVNDANKQILQSDEQLAECQRRILEDKLNALTTFTSGFISLLDEAGKQSVAAAVASKALASAEAAINSYLAFTNAMASVPYPYNFIAAAGVLASGLAAQVKIISTPIPSAETGGRFIVPNGTGVDSQIMRVNPGEQIDVTPRGMTGQSENFNFNFVMDGRVFAEIVNKQARAGELYTLQLAGNL